MKMNCIEVYSYLNYNFVNRTSVLIVNNFKFSNTLKGFIDIQPTQKFKKTLPNNYDLLRMTLNIDFFFSWFEMLKQY